MLLSVTTHNSGCRPSRAPAEGRHLVVLALVDLLHDRAGGVELDRIHELDVRDPTPRRHQPVRGRAPVLVAEHDRVFDPLSGRPGEDLVIHEQRHVRETAHRVRALVQDRRVRRARTCSGLAADTTLERDFHGHVVRAGRRHGIETHGQCRVTPPQAARAGRGRPQARDPAPAAGPASSGRPRASESTAASRRLVPQSHCGQDAVTMATTSAGSVSVTPAVARGLLASDRPPAAVTGADAPPAAASRVASHIARHVSMRGRI